jgi:threonine dehydrogenase-like Zn-dependent dehydrogenase
VGLVAFSGMTVRILPPTDDQATVRELLGSLKANGAFNPPEILTQREPVTGAIDAYEAFDQRSPGWIKVELEPSTS